MEPSNPRGSIYTTIMELGPKRPSPLWFWGPNSIIVVYMDPLGIISLNPNPQETSHARGKHPYNFNLQSKSLYPEAVTPF